MEQEHMKDGMVANFNLVFYGEDGKEEPLLKYFDKIFMPALTSKYVKKTGDSEYFFTKINLEEAEDGEYVLTGLLVKRTTLEVKSDVDEEWNIIEKDERHPSAPFSIFVIYLKNHRMLFVKNQKGSPTIQNFSATAKDFLNRFVRSENRVLKKYSKEEFPIPILNVVGIPMRKKLVQSLGEVEKINELCLRFYPLNGDIDFGGILGDISNDVRKAVECKRADLVLKSPGNIKELIDLVEKSNGIVEPIFRVTYIDERGRKKKTRIKNETISESMKLDIKQGDLKSEISQIISEGKKIESITYVSEGNNKIYSENCNKIISFAKK